MKMKNFVSLFPCAGHLLSPHLSTPFLQLPNLNAVCATLVVEELLRCGLAHVVMCPGSRCAPLTVAVVRSGCPHTLANDERGAGFLALGYARASGRCAAVLVSSGTAVANLLPAVVEAGQDHVPLVLLTADRPPEARDTAANQAINQVGLLGGGNLRWFKDMPCPAVDMAIEPLLSDASYAVARACAVPCGPVQLNFMLREPLAPSVQPWPREMLTRSPRVAQWMQSRAPFCSHLRPYNGPGHVADAQLLPVLTLMRGARRGMIVAGATFTCSQRRAIADLAASIQWPVLPDVCSGMRSPTTERGVQVPLVPLFDLLLSDSAVRDALDVDVVLQVGGRLVSKRLQALVASARTAHVLIEQHNERMDPDHCVTHRLQGDAAALLEAMTAGLEFAARSPLVALCDASKAAEHALGEAFEAAADISEPWVAHCVCQALTNDTDTAPGEMLFISNSLPIRHVDNFCAITPLVASNRGASGIDGIVHSAIGVALGSGARCTLLVGDLAMLHDINALATLSKTKASLLIVVLNNSGGGIFRFLPIAGHDDVYSPYFDTPHEHNFAELCAGFGIPHTFARTCATFRDAFDSARHHTGPSVIEVPSDKEQGHAIVAELRLVGSDAGRKAFVDALL